MITLHINDQPRDIDVSPDTPLLWVLRDKLGLTGTKYGCGIAQCGACTVHVDGEPVRSCQMAVGKIGGRKITTIEAIGETQAGAKIQKAWLDLEVIQLATASPARSCRRRHCSPTRLTLTILTSMQRWLATSAAVVPTSASEQR